VRLPPPNENSGVCLQEVEFHVQLDQDEKLYNLTAGQRVYVTVPAKAMMGFEQHMVESTPLVSK
jgi:hypothetical protein